MNSDIPDEAVEAAARELFFQHSNTNGPSLSRIWDEALNEDLKSPFMRDARAALVAAAPSMLSHAWERGAVAGWKQSGEGFNAEYPDESTGECSVDLSGNPFRKAAAKREA